MKIIIAERFRYHNELRKGYSFFLLEILLEGA